MLDRMRLDWENDRRSINMPGSRLGVVVEAAAQGKWWTIR